MIAGIPAMEFTGPAALTFVALLVISGRLVWHTQVAKLEKRHAAELAKVEGQRDRWQDVALRSLGVADKMTVHAEVANEIVSKLPDPASVTEL